MPPRHVPPHYPRANDLYARDRLSLDVGERIPGYKASAVFFDSLRTNLLLADGPGTRASSPNPADGVCAKCSASVDSAGTKLDDNESGLSASLNSSSTKKRQPVPLQWVRSDARRAGLELLSASVSNQRYLAFRSLISHPLTVFLWLVLLFIARKTNCLLNPVICETYSIMPNPGPSPAANSYYDQYGNQCSGYFEDEEFYDVYRSTIYFPARVMILWAACTSAILAAAWLISWMYLAEGKNILRDDWLHEEDEMLVAVYNHCHAKDEVVGVLILSRVQGAKQCGKRRRAGRGYIRGWAVRDDYQGRGIGKEMLKEAVRVCMKERGGERVWFFNDFAHAYRPLHSLYNGAFDKRDRRARLALLTAIDDVMTRTHGCGSTRRRS